jgi:ADP-heptose:LPS heptosyltransferase
VVRFYLDYSNPAWLQKEAITPYAASISEILPEQRILRRYSPGPHITDPGCFGDSAVMRMWKIAKARIARAAVWDDQFSLGLFSRLLFKPLPLHASENSIQHIVIHRTDNMTDILIAIPAMAAVRKRFPQAKITLLTLSDDIHPAQANAVLEAFPGLIHRILSYTPSEIKSLHALQALKKRMLECGSIDLWINLPMPLTTFQRSAQEVFLARWMDSRHALGFTVLLPDILQKAYARFYKENIIRTSDWLLDIIQRGLNIHADANDYLNFFQLPSTWDITSLNLDPSQSSILIVNAGAESAIKRWPAAHFQILLNQIENSFPNLQIVLLGSPEDRLLHDHIAATLTRPAINVSGQLSLLETWSLLNQACAILSNDTDTMHMAGLLRKPVFTPMSGQFPGPLQHPPGPPLIEFHKPVPCSPCFKTTCPLNEQICMTLLTPESIAPDIIELLGTILD